MMGNQEAAALLIKNIGMFEQATLLLNEIGVKVDNAINQKIKEWVSNSYGEWLFDDESLDKNGVVYFTHKSCVGQNEDANWMAYFSLAQIGDIEDQWWLASYCGKGKSRCGISFGINHESFGVTQAKLRKFLQEKELQTLGFKFQSADAGWWFLPFQLDAENLAAAYAEEAIEDALGPIEDALNKVKEAWPKFKQIVDATAKKFPNSET